jgi:hypothetical protein
MLERIHKVVKRSSSPPESVIELLKNTLIGTNGSLYELLDTEKKIHQLHQANFLYLERNGKAIGNVTVCKREIALNQFQFQSLYLRYFAFDKTFQAGGHLNKVDRSHSAFQQYLLALFNTSNFNPLQAEQDKSMYWAFIDPQNSRSFQMNKRFGFQSIGTFQTTAFSRVNPKAKASVSRIAEPEKTEVEQLINTFYTGFNLYSKVHLFDNDDYFVLKINNEIVAGIQANPVHWKIKSLPGKSGKFLINHAPKIPRIKKLINPENHQFLATEGLFWKDGHELLVQELLEGVLQLSKRNSLLIWTDSKNKMLEKLSVNWGFIQKTKANNSIDIVAKFNGFQQSEVDQIKENKKYLSGFDMT